MPKPQKGGPWVNPDNGPAPEETMGERVFRWGRSIRDSKIVGAARTLFSKGGEAVSKHWVAILGGLVASGVLIGLYEAGTFDDMDLQGFIDKLTQGGGTDTAQASMIPAPSGPAVPTTTAAPESPTTPATPSYTPDELHDMQGPSDPNDTWMTKEDLDKRLAELEAEAKKLEADVAAAGATPESAGNMPETVADYPLTDGDGITQAVMKLKENWPPGVPMPTWLQNIHSPQDVAEWARLNNFYTPEQVKDSIIMYKGDVLSVNAEGELILKNPDGTYNVLTDRDGRASPNPIPDRDFSDSVPTELPDARAAELLTQTAVINNPPVESFARQNPWPVDTTEYRAWEGMRDFITTYAPGDSWKTSSLSVGEYLQKLKVGN